MCNSKEYTDEFRAEAVNQVIERGFTMVDIAARIGIPRQTQYGWVQVARKMALASGASAAPSDSVELSRLKVELRRVTEGRDIPKTAAAYFRRGKGEVSVHARAHPRVPPDRDMPGAGRAPQRLLRLVALGRQCAREQDDQRLLGLIRHHWLTSGAVYGYRKTT